MKLENMDVTSNNDSESITADVNLMTNELNFSPISEEARESGDGDSGGESKENLEFDETLNNPGVTQDSLNIAPDNQDAKKLKRVSKIPVRQTKLPFVPKIAHHKNANLKSGDCCDNSDIANWDLEQVRSCGDNNNVGSLPVEECDRLPILQGSTFNQPNDENVSGIQTGLNPNGKEFEQSLIERSPTDFGDIFLDLTTAHEVGDEVHTESLTSLSPRAPLAAEDLEVPIIEAPEEFRCVGASIEEQVVNSSSEPEERHSNASYRDADNACKTETGDTSRRTTEDAGDHGSAPPNGLAEAEDDPVGPVVDSETAPPTMRDCEATSCITRGVGAESELDLCEDECAEERDAVNVPGPSQSSGDVCARLCADKTPSIEIGVAKCAQASGCSRVSTAKVCVALDPGPLSDPAGSKGKTSKFAEQDCENGGSRSVNGSKALCWRFKAGRLVFEEPEESAEVGNNDSDNSQDNDEVGTILHSKDLNKRVDESRSRLKYLEQKLKEAGITDDESLDDNTKHVNSNQHKCKKKTVEQVVDKFSTIQNNKHLDYDANQNILNNQLAEDTKDEGSDTIDFCEFDVRQVGTFSGYNGYCEVYDELDEDSDGEQEHIITRRIRQTNMGIDGERAKHNPDRDNLKSLLKRPGKNKDKRSNRVVFNENKNEFFDADYIILIREECDYDEEDDDGVCTCNQHEMVRLTCCEPNCNCNVYDGYEQTPQSPKFAPPLEFVDAVTLSPPEGYKDMELEEQQLLALQQIARRGQRTAVCRECSVTHEDAEEDGDGSQSDNEACGETNSDHEEQEEKEKTDQSQQTTPTTPPNDSDSPNSQRYILETITMTTVTEQRILREVEEERKTPNINVVPGGSPINGILKGGRLWKQQSVEATATKPEPQQIIDSSVASDEESSSRRSVRFIESEQNKRDGCDGAPDNSTDENKTENSNVPVKENENCNSSVSPESTEMMLTFKLGNHVLISNNSLKPNSAVRQLFPCTKQLNGKAEDESIHQYLVTAESLRAFEEAKRSKLPQIIQSGETDESIKRAIERNTLRRSLIRYEPRSKKNVQKTDNSLVERIKQLTCDVDDINQSDEIHLRASPPGEEARNSPEVTHNVCKNSDKSFSPSSSSTASSNSSSMSSTYKKITDLFGKREKMPDAQNNLSEPKLAPSLPDLGNGGPHIHEITEMNHCAVTKVNSTSESRKQFLSTLAPLTACVGGLSNGDEYYYQMSNHAGERASVASSVGTEYSLEDIDEGLKNGDEDQKKIAPDVLAGTPSASESGDELAMFVQQDASRIERIKKKYQPEQQSNKEDDDDEHDDYGFNRRPSVRGIKPRFGSTTEILQQIQNQLQPPVTTARVAWPYYSESGLTGVDNSKSRNINQNMPNYQYPNVPEEVKTRNIAPQYRPTSLQDENIYQNCTNQRCIREVYRANGNQAYSSVMKVGGGCTEYYQSVPRTRNGRPQSPPPLELSKTYHQTMVYIPYNHIEGYQPTPYYQSNDYVRVSNQNQINKRYIEPIYQQRIHASHVDEHHYASNMLPPMPLKPMVRIPLSQQPHLMASRSESPVPGQFSTARSTQTPLAVASNCGYYPGTPRYRPMVGPVWPNDCNYVKPNRHSFPASVPRYPPPDSISLTDSDSQHSGQIPNGYRQSVDVTYSTPKDSIPNSPTKPRFLERGVPEGAAASVPSQDASTNSQSSSSTMTSPTSPQNPPHTNQKPLFYAMNV